MKIKKKFIQLTNFTYPNGTESLLEKFLPNGYEKDKYGNYFLKIGDSNTMFTCHLDTACKERKKVKHLISQTGQYLVTDGTTILGADDKAGMVVVLYMIEKNIPGLYYFFVGEEVGCLGSSDVASAMEAGEIWKDHKINKVVSFDRRGNNSVITDQFYGTCCSDEFAKALCSELNKGGLSMVPDNTGILTDSAQFMTLIPECTNISVGYNNEHTTSEIQDLHHLYKLCNAVTKVDWDNLPIERNPKEIRTWWGSDYYDDYEWSSLAVNDPVTEKSPQLGLTFTKDYYTFVKKGENRVQAYVSKEWITHEISRINDALIKTGYKPQEIFWDGTSCWILDMGAITNEYIGNRSDFCDMITNFDIIPVAHLRYDLNEKEELF